jgi:hypothetical protein
MLVLGFWHKKRRKKQGGEKTEGNEEGKSTNGKGEEGKKQHRKGWGKREPKPPNRATGGGFPFT